MRITWNLGYRGNWGWNFLLKISIILTLPVISETDNNFLILNEISYFPNLIFNFYIINLNLSVNKLYVKPKVKSLLYKCFTFNLKNNDVLEKNSYLWQCNWQNNEIIHKDSLCSIRFQSNRKLYYIYFHTECFNI